MKSLFLATSLFAILNTFPSHAQQKSPIKQTIERIAQKYRTITANADVVTANGIPVAKETRFILPEDEVVPDYSNLRQIALVRHGEPDIAKTGKFSFEEARQYVTKYDSVGIVVPDKPFFEIERPEEVAIFTSSIARATATARYLFGDSTDMTVSPDFREFETRINRRNFNFKLPIKLWTASARLRWMLGLGEQDIETFAEAKARAEKAAELLAEATEEKPKVVLVAHGFLNRYIKQDLEEMGWRVVKDGGSGYFATTVLVKLEPKKEGNNPISLHTGG
ncbi:histidine phosphatase family protein [Pontibacter russatus]|uniref:histidine phosphatase family protein n=1 Tax=Pontibacter russatus TaxID=2694929 RepID=UPI00137B1821|nr:histidine phosphatase family protein [Pontibacter russatus]